MNLRIIISIFIGVLLASFGTYVMYSYFFDDPFKRSRKFSQITDTISLLLYTLFRVLLGAIIGIVIGKFLIYIF